MLEYLKQKGGSVVAKYYLTENGKPNTLNEVTWAKLDFSNYKPNVLEDIDNFCMSFDNVEDLKKHLLMVAAHDYNNGLITVIPKFKNQLNIRFVYGKAITKLSYGLPFKNDKVYFNHEYLRQRLIALRGDDTFFLRLSNKFGNSPIQGRNAATFYRLGISLRQGTPFKEEDRLEYVIEDFIKVEVLKYDKKEKQYVTDSNNDPIYQWRKLHDLAMFVKAYENPTETDEFEEEKAVVEKEESPQLTLF